MFFLNLKKSYHENIHAFCTKITEIEREGDVDGLRSKSFAEKTRWSVSRRDCRKPWVH